MLARAVLSHGAEALCAACSVGKAEEATEAAISQHSELGVKKKQSCRNLAGAEIRLVRL
jgi:hypothetical protein